MMLIVNGEACDISCEDRATLADILRDQLRLTGVHLGCEHGPCGACTVLVDDEPVRACLMLAVQAHGKRVDTVEGLSPNGTLDVVQRALSEKVAFQCAFCAPGFLMAITHFLRHNPSSSRAEVRTALSGNLCRCTGYEPIIDATLLAAARLRADADDAHRSGPTDA